MALTKIDDRGLKTPIDLLDDEKIRFGTGNDLSIYHQSSNGKNYIVGTNTQTILQAKTGESSIVMSPDGGVDLYYDDIKTFETYTHGITVKGPEGGTGVIQLFADEGDDNADKWHFLANTDGTLLIRNLSDASWETNIKCVGAGATELYYDNVKRLNTTSNGVQVDGDLLLDNATNAGKDVQWDESANRFYFTDDVSAVFGDSADLRLYHASGNSYIENVTGELIVNGDTIHLKDGGNNETLLKAVKDGAVELYYDNVKTFSTTTGGAIVQGGEGESAVLYMYSDEGDDAGDKWVLKVDNGDQDFRIRNLASGSWEENLICNSNGAVELHYDGSKKLSTTSTGAKIESGSATTLHLVSNPSYSASIEFGDTDDDDEAEIWYDNYSKALNFRTTEDADLVFYREGTERQRLYHEGLKLHGFIKAHPNISDSHWGDNTSDWSLIGSNANGGAVCIFEHSGDTSPYGIEVTFTDNTPDSHDRYFYWAGDLTSARFRVYADGDVWNHDDEYTGSDATLKENIVDATPKLEDLKKLKVRNFNWKADYFPERSKRKHLGFIAQEVEEVFPALVTEHDIAGGSPSDSNHTPVMKKAIKQAWSPIIIKAMQELIEKVETLETEVAALKAK